MFLHPLQVDVTLHFIVVAFQVQSGLFGVLPKMLFLEAFLIFEQDVVERPKKSLRTGRFGRFGGKFSIWMDVDQGIAAKHKSEPMAEVLEYDFHGPVRLFAGRTFKIAIFNHGHIGGRQARNVVGSRVWRQNSFRNFDRIHGLPPRGQAGCIHDVSRGSSRPHAHNGRRGPFPCYGPDQPAS